MTYRPWNLVYMFLGRSALVSMQICCLVGVLVEPHTHNSLSFAGTQVIFISPILYATKLFFFLNLASVCACVYVHAHVDTAKTRNRMICWVPSIGHPSPSFSFRFSKPPDDAIGIGHRIFFCLCTLFQQIKGTMLRLYCSLCPIFGVN